MTLDYRVIKTQPAPSTHRSSGDRLSIHATADDPELQDLAATLTPVCTGVEVHISVDVTATMLLTRLRTTNDSGMSIWGLSGSIK